jgi:hypothetical protein
LAQFGENTVIGAGGDMSDWQYLQHAIQDEMYCLVFNPMLIFLFF